VGTRLRKRVRDETRIFQLTIVYRRLARRLTKLAKLWRIESSSSVSEFGNDLVLPNENTARNVVEGTLLPVRKNQSRRQDALL
jgi:hypothetical protein